MFTGRIFKFNRKVLAFSTLVFGVTVITQVVAGILSTLMWFSSLFGSVTAAEYYANIQEWMAGSDTLYDIMLYSFIAVVTFALIEKSITAYEKKLAAKIKVSSD